MGKGGRGTDYETQGGGGGHKIEGEEGWDGNGGAPCLVSLGGSHYWRGAAAQDAREFRMLVACGGVDDAGIQNIVKNTIQCQDFPLTC
jgi:hypothetical protein